MQRATRHATGETMTQLPVVPTENEETARKVRPPADPSTMAHRDLLDGEFWRRIPAFKDVVEADI